MADGLARQIAGLAGDIRNLGKRIPSYQRGVVANVSPPTVVMDRDVTATPRPVADVLVPGLAVGQRVEVRVIGSRRVITSIHPGDLPQPVETGWISLPLINGWSMASGLAPLYRRSGTLLFLRGRVSGGSGVIANLPSGFAPTETWSQVARQGSGTNDSYAFLVTPAGAISPGSALTIPNLDAVIPLG